jgi:uncharacterized membrane protein
MTSPADDSGRVVLAPTGDLNQAVHGVLVAGLVVSTSLILIGLGLSLMLDRTLPPVVLRPAEALRQAAMLRPVGFISLGLIVLILTPVMRVIGSVVVFVRERDWRYAGITLRVLVVILISLWVGQG